MPAVNLSFTSKEKSPKRRNSSTGEGDDAPASSQSRFSPKRAAWIASSLAVLGCLGVWGLLTLEHQLLADHQLAILPTVVFTGDMPEAIQEVLVEHLGDLVDEPIGAPGLSGRMGERLAENAWVGNVESVVVRNDGFVVVDCTLRRPMAVVQDGGNFVLVAEDGTRLPGRYNINAGYPIIQGVAGPMPWVGQRFEQPDVEAGLQLVRMIQDQPFLDQIRAVRVHNFDGRLNRAEPQIELATDAPGGRILWGSAPGLEVEETTPQEKLAILRHNYDETGRIDANYPVIEIATFADKFIVPAAEKGV